jgi:hypothetical protein
MRQNFGHTPFKTFWGFIFSKYSIELSDVPIYNDHSLLFILAIYIFFKYTVKHAD